MMCCVWSFLWFVFEWIIRTAIKPFKNSLVPTPYAHGHIRQQLNASLPLWQRQPAPVGVFLSTSKRVVMAKPLHLG